jgi:hypothetical protein
MLRAAALALSLVAIAASPAAAASKDDGPYTPFPESNPVQRALDYVHQLNQQRLPTPERRQAATKLTPQHLTRGASLPDPGTTPKDEKALPKAASSPSRRAGVSAGGGGPAAAALPFALLAAVLAAAAIGFEVRARRRRPLRA